MTDVHESSSASKADRVWRFLRAVRDDYCRAVGYKNMPIAQWYSETAIRGAASRASHVDT